MAEPQQLKLAREQLDRVQVAAFDPIDWSDVAMYGFYALENAVVVAADHSGIVWKRTHPSKVDVANKLHAKHHLPDVADLLVELNSLRKSEAYGEAPPSRRWSAEDVAVEVEGYIEAVADLVKDDG
jgi:hypothetical protein